MTLQVKFEYIPPIIPVGCLQPFDLPLLLLIPAKRFMHIIIFVATIILTALQKSVRWGFLAFQNKLGLELAVGLLQLLMNAQC